MKKVVLVFAALLLLAAPCLRAQSVQDEFIPFQELEVGSGLFSVPQLALTMGAVFGTAFSFGLASFDNLKFSSAISAEYYYNLKPHVAVGGAAVFDSIWGDQMRKNTSTGEYEPSGKFSGLFLSLMPAVKFSWLNHEHFRIYSKLAAGGSIGTTPGSDSEESSRADGASDTDNGIQFIPAFQVSPVCLSAGGGHCWGKLEFGVGMLGLVQAGFVYRL